MHGVVLLYIGLYLPRKSAKRFLKFFEGFYPAKFEKNGHITEN